MLGRVGFGKRSSNMDGIASVTGVGVTAGLVDRLALRRGNGAKIRLEVDGKESVSPAFN